MLQAASSATGAPQDTTTTQKRAQKAKAVKMATVHMLENHSPESSDHTWDKETSSEEEESQATATMKCRQIDLDRYPEAKQELYDMESFYTQEQNLRRRGVALKATTWRKAKIHIQSESVSE